ncbi:MAG: hypothetical protein R3A52_28995 [Polyangiales bacterium]
MIEAKHRALGLALAGLAVFGAFGCASTARDITRATAPAAIAGTLEGLTDRDNQRMMRELLASPEMRRAARDFAGQVVDASLDTLTEPERVARVEAMTQRYMTSMTRVMMREMAAGMRRDLTPALAGMVRATVASAMREALSEGYQRDLERVTAGLTRAAVDSASRGMAEGLTRDLGPALQRTLTDENTVRALGASSRTLAREMVLGSNDALAQIQRAQERGQAPPSLLSRITKLSDSGIQIAQWVAIGGVVLSIALAMWVARLLIRSRRAQVESERNAADALILAEAIRDAEGRPWAQELTDIVQDRLRRQADPNSLESLLRRRSTVPAEPPRSRIHTQRPSHA